MTFFLWTALRITLCWDWNILINILFHLSVKILKNFIKFWPMLLFIIPWNQIITKRRFADCFSSSRNRVLVKKHINCQTLTYTHIRRNTRTHSANNLMVVIVTDTKFANLLKFFTKHLTFTMFNPYRTNIPFLESLDVFPQIQFSNYTCFK